MDFLARQCRYSYTYFLLVQHTLFIPCSNPHRDISFRNTPCSSLAVTLTVTSVSGAIPAMYVTNSYFRGASADASLPSPSTAIWWADASGGGVSPSDDYYYYYTDDSSSSGSGSTSDMGDIDGSGRRRLQKQQTKPQPEGGDVGDLTDGDSGSVPELNLDEDVNNNNLGADPAPPGTIRILATDPAMTSCPNCTDFTIALWPIRGASTYSLTLISDSSSLTLTLNVPSGVVTLPAGSTSSYTFGITDTDPSTGGDLLISVTRIGGGAINQALAGTSPDSTCAMSSVPGSSGSFSAQCPSAPWTTASASIPLGSAVQMRVNASAPCDVLWSPASSRVCNASTSWRTGRYFLTIAALGPGDAVFSVVISQLPPDRPSITQLLGGIPVDSVFVPPAFSSFLFMTTPGTFSSPPVRFMVTSSSNADISVYLNSCIQRDCTFGASTPGPFNSGGSFIVPPFTAVNFIVDTDNALYCYDGSPQRQACVFYLVVSVQTPATCASSPGGVCPAPFEIIAVTEGAGAPSRITWSATSYGHISDQAGGLWAVNQSDPYEVSALVVLREREGERVDWY